MNNKSEPLPENVEVQEGVLDEVAGETSTTNAAEAEKISQIEGELPKEGEPTTEAPKTADGKKIPSAKYYKAFSNGALTTLDKTFELIWGIAFEPEVDTNGLKTKNPKDFEDNVILLAEQLELTEAEIKAWMGWMLVCGAIMIPYGKLTKDMVQENKAIKVKKAETLKATLNKTTPVKTEVEEAIEVQEQTKEKAQGEPIKKRGNWRYHAQPCPCSNCKQFRDGNGNIKPDNA